MGIGCVYTARRPWEGEYFKSVQRGLSLALASGGLGGMSKRGVREFDKFLECGNPIFGFVQVYCPTCRDSCAVAFSCKGHLCPSCGQRRAEEAVFHWEKVLPDVGYRMWTLSLPRPLRFAAVKDRRFFQGIQRALVQAVGRWQKQQARPHAKKQQLKAGALVFVQFFGSALQLTPHFHVLVPEVVWKRDGDTVCVSMPDETQLQKILERILRQLKKKYGEDGIEQPPPEDEEETQQMEAIQQRLAFSPEDMELPKTRKPMAVVMNGFSLHVGRRIHENDKEGLRYVIRYAARGPISQKRVKRLEDGRVRYEAKNGRVVHFTPESFVRRLSALVPPKGLHLTVGHGVFAPRHSLRDKVTRREEAQAPKEAAPAEEAAKRKRKKPPRLNWAELQRRTFKEDVFLCRCGGKRKIRAIIENHDEARAVLKRMGVPMPPGVKRVEAQSPPDRQLSLAH